MLAQLLQKPIQRWISKQLPPADEIQLGLHNIMILPTRLGMALLLLIGLIFVLAVNYENSMAFALSFFLLSLWLIALHATFQNLSGLKIRLHGLGHAHAGDEVAYQFEFSSDKKRSHYSVEAFWQLDNRTSLNVAKGKPEQHKVFCQCKERGYLAPGRLQLVSYFPLMLFRAWSSMALARQALIFPKPIASPLPQNMASASASSASARQSQGSEEFDHLRAYQSGDPLHRIAWKASAKQRETLLTKSFDAPADQRLWLDYQSMPGPDHEQKISQLCYWVMQLEQQQVFYGLKVAEQCLPPNRGAEHYIQALTLLARQPKARATDAA